MEQEKQALVSALRLLAATPKSRKTLMRKLAERGYPSEVLDRTMTHLEKQGLLNDKALALSLLRSFVNVRPSGRKKIAFELKKRGIQSDIAQNILDEYSPEEERGKALELAKDKQTRWQKLEPVKRRKKIYAFLLRRGFEYSLARDVLEETERKI